MIEEVIDGTPVYYYRNPGGELIARTDATNGIRYYHFDALGSTRLLTKANGDVTDRYSYDAWGTVIAHDRYEGSIDQPYQYVGQLGYYTHYQDPEFKLLQLGVRFYDAEIGRFISRDIFRVDYYSCYVYSNGIPTQLRDATGEFTLIQVSVAVGLCLVGGGFEAFREYREQDEEGMGIYKANIACKALIKCLFTSTYALLVPGPGRVRILISVLKRLGIIVGAQIFHEILETFDGIDRLCDKLFPKQYRCAPQPSTIGPWEGNYTR